MVSRNYDEPSIQSSASAAGGELADLRRQMQSHEEHDQSKSYLGRAISFVWGRDEQSLARMQDLQRQAESAQKTGDTQAAARVQMQIAEQVTADRKEVELQDQINHYAGGVLKTGALFLRGRLGLAGTIGVYALDQMNPRDSLKTQLTDMTLGMAKGGLMRGAFHLLGQKDVSVAAKGVGLGISSRTLDLGLTRSTYMTASGDFSLSTGLANTLNGSLSQTAIATDAIVFVGAHGLFKGADSLAGGAIKRSPLLTTMLTGTTFGISNGATGEIARQQAAGESFDVWKVIQRSMLQGALDTFAAAPGGLKARAANKQLEMKSADATGRRLDVYAGSSTSKSGAREFVVTNGKDSLAAFEGKESQAAWLRVKEILGQRSDGQPNLGIEKTLVLTHRGQSGLPEAFKTADLIATCNPETLAPSLRAKHVFGAGEGPVWLGKAFGGERLHLSIGDNPSAAAHSGYERVLQLGFSREVRRALEKAEAGDKHYKAVDMDGIGKLTAKPTDKDKLILTAGLGGCTAVVLLVERADGTRTAVISHEIAFRSEEQFRKIQKTARTIPGLLDPGTKKTALVFTAQAYEGDAFTGRVKLIAGKSGDERGEAHLIESLKSDLGVTSIKRMTYNANSIYSNPVDEGVLLLRLPAGRPATFKTWFGPELPFDFKPGNDNVLPKAPAGSARVPLQPAVELPNETTLGNDNALPKAPADSARVPLQPAVELPNKTLANDNPLPEAPLIL